MQTRERGAAHINIFFFLVMLVLFLGALGFGYVQTTEKTSVEEHIATLIEQNRQLEADILIRQHYIEDLQAVVGEAGTYAGRDGFVYDDKDDPNDRAPSPLENVSVPERVKAALVGFARDTGTPESTAQPVSSLLAQTKALIDAKQKRVSDVEALNATLSSAKTQAEASTATANQEKATEVASLNQKQTELRQYIDTEFTKREQTNLSLRNEMRDRQSELDAEREARKAEVAGLGKQINLLNGRIEAQRRVTDLVNPPNEPDGSVISSSQVAGRAWIDLGRKNMLPRGTVFKITSPNSQVAKGYARVERLEYDRAEVSLFDVADRFDPIVRGDRLYNDVYSPNVKRNIFLLGRFSYPMTKPTVKLMLEKLGNHVADKIGPGVDLVLVGADTINEEHDGYVPIEDNDDYKKALFLGIEITTMNKVRDFLVLADTE